MVNYDVHVKTSNVTRRLVTIVLALSGTATRGEAVATARAEKRPRHANEQNRN